MPKVCVVIPTYNRAGLLKEAVRSVQIQSFDDWECLVIDDHSTDNTREVILSFVDSDRRIRYLLNQGRKGAQGARNTGISQASSEYIIFLDSDDLLGDNCLRHRIDFALQYPGKGFYCFLTGVFRERLFDSPYLWNYLNTADDDLVRFFNQDMPWHTTGALWRKDSLDQLNGWDENLACWQDWDLHVRALLNKNITYLKCSDDKYFIDSFYRKNRDNQSISNFEITNKSLESKIYLISKTANQIVDFSKTARFAFTKLIFRISNHIHRYKNREEALRFLEAHLLKLNYSSFFCGAWVSYLKYRFDTAYPRIIRKFFDLIPFWYGKNSLLKHKTTHLKAIIKADD